MSTEQNKAVVRRFINDVLIGGNADAIDEVCAPTYVNKALGGAGLAAFKESLPAMASLLPGRNMEIEELVAEGDAVVARFSFEYTQASGEKLSGRGLTYYGLAGGRIAVDDPITTPDLTQWLGALMGQMGAASR
jgi:predicted ester cyclase